MLWMCNSFGFVRLLFHKLYGPVVAVPVKYYFCKPLNFAKFLHREHKCHWAMVSKEFASFKHPRIVLFLLHTSQNRPNICHRRKHIPIRFVWTVHPNRENILNRCDFSCTLLFVCSETKQQTLWKFTIQFLAPEFLKWRHICKFTWNIVLRCTHAWNKKFQLFPSNFRN